MIGIALCFGFGLSWYTLNGGTFFGTIDIGPWTAWRDVGSPAPDPYTRAYIARNGGLQLGASEGMQFIANADSDNHQLDRSCNYRIDGTTPVARFWTLAAVEPQTGAIITRPDAPPNFESDRLARADDGSIELYVGRHLSPRNWLEITGDGPFALVLTLYDTTTLSGNGSDAVTMPSIIREGCA